MWHEFASFVTWHIILTSTITITLALPVIILILPTILPSSIRLKFSEIPLGLTKRRNPKKHAIRNLENNKSLKSYVESLTSRSAKTTIGKQVAKTLKTHQVVVTTSKPNHMGYQHLQVLYQHEKDAYGCGVKSVLSSIMRFTVAKCMTGNVDNYYIPEKGKLQLVAWTQTIIKGDTLRAMVRVLF